MKSLSVVDLVRALAQLVVGGLQFVVRRLQLLVHRLELLVGRLQLLVGRLQLLDRRLQFLVGRLELLVGRLQLLVGGLELAVGGLELVLQLPEARHVVEDDRRRRAGGRAPSTSGTSWMSRTAARPAERVPLDVAQPRPSRGVSRTSVEVRAQLDRPVGDLEIVERAAEVALGRAPNRVAARWLSSANRSSRVDDELGDRAGRGTPRCAAASVVVLDGGCGARLGSGRRASARRPGRGDALRKNRRLQVDRLEQRGVVEQHLRLAEEQHPVGRSAKWKPGHDPRLGLGVEVHQRVAAERAGRCARSGRPAPGRCGRR